MNYFCNKLRLIIVMRSTSAFLSLQIFGFRSVKYGFFHSTDKEIFIKIQNHVLRPSNSVLKKIRW